MTGRAKPCNFCLPDPPCGPDFPSGRCYLKPRLGRGFLCVGELSPEGLARLRAKILRDISAPTRRLASTGRDLSHALGMGGAHDHSEFLPNKCPAVSSADTVIPTTAPSGMVRMWSDGFDTQRLIQMRFD